MRTNWEKVVESCLTHLTAHGFTVQYSTNPEEPHNKFESDSLASHAENICCCDEGRARVTGSLPDERYTLYFVLGNAPHEVVCDYAYSSKPELSRAHDWFAAVLSAWSDWAEEQGDEYWAVTKED